MANRTGYPECSHEVCIQAAGDRGGGQIICEKKDADAPVLQRCARCGFSDEIEDDGRCLLCSQIVARGDAA